jgi:hypothetical protein
VVKDLSLGVANHVLTIGDISFRQSCDSLKRANESRRMIIKYVPLKLGSVYKINHIKGDQETTNQLKEL